MKKTIILFIALFSFSVYGQEIDYSAYFKGGEKLDTNKLDTFVGQVFGSKSSEFKTTIKYQDYKDLLTNRLVIVNLPTSINENIKSTSDLNLILDYNKNLSYDKEYSISSFNPIKYDLDIFPKVVTAYRIGDSDHIIVIIP